MKNIEKLEMNLAKVNDQVDCERSLAIACDLRVQAMEERRKASECGGGASEIEKLILKGVINGIAISIVGQGIV